MDLKVILRFGDKDVEMEAEEAYKIIGAVLGKKEYIPYPYPVVIERSTSPYVPYWTREWTSPYTGQVFTYTITGGEKNNG